VTEVTYCVGPCLGDFDFFGMCFSLPLFIILPLIELSDILELKLSALSLHDRMLLAHDVIPFVADSLLFKFVVLLHCLHRLLLFDLFHEISL